MLDVRRHRRLGRRALLLLAELLVVFAGVYAASLLDDRRAERKDLERRRQALMAMHEQFAEIQSEFAREGTGLAATVDTFEARYRRGETPRPFPLSFTAGADASLWEALLASSGDVMPTDLIVQVEVVNGYMRAMMDGALRLRDLSDRYIIPNASADLATFYTADGRLRPEYRWYLQGLVYMRDRMTSLTVHIDSTRIRIDDALLATETE